jgi:hypothetical protein
VIIGDYHIRPDKSKRNYMNSLVEFGHGVIEKHNAVYYKASSGKYCKRVPMWLPPPCIGKKYCIKCYHGIVSSVIIDFLQKFNGKNIGNDRQLYGELRNSGMTPGSKLRAESDRMLQEVLVKGETARGAVLAASGLKERTGACWDSLSEKGCLFRIRPKATFGWGCRCMPRAGFSPIFIRRCLVK